MNNDIQIRPQLQPTAPALNAPQKGSVFDNFEQFNQYLQMATVLSKTQLIPQNFQEKPEDCLIALDFALRLGVSPSSVLPELYVIHGRPATSAKFMISLVNRSGVFSRIQWKESIDGEIEFFANGSKRTIPNYSATAYFKELDSGEVYESPKIDMKFALSNGWLTKNDSQWQKMPQVMARYRSASILIKTVCPELAMGMEALEDARDSDDDERPARRAVREVESVLVDEKQPAEAEDKTDDEEQRKLYDEFAARIAKANGQELRVIGADICHSNLDDRQKEQLREVFKQRRIELAQAAIDETKREDVKPEQQEADPKPARRASKKSAERKLPVSAEAKKAEREFAEGIKQAETEADLDEAVLRIDAATSTGVISGEQYGELRDMIAKRLNEIKAARAANGEICLDQVYRDIESANATDEQKRWAKELVEAIVAAVSVDFITENLVPQSNEWLEKEWLTAELHQAVTNAVVIRSKIEERNN